MSAACGCGDSEEGAGEEDRGDRRRDRLEGRASECRGPLHGCGMRVRARRVMKSAKRPGRPVGAPKPKEQTLLVMYEAPVKPLEVTSGGQVRTEVQVERRARERDLFVGVSATGVPVRDLHREIRS